MEKASRVAEEQSKQTCKEQRTAQKFSWSESVDRALRSRKCSLVGLGSLWTPDHCADAQYRPPHHLSRLAIICCHRIE